MTVTDDTATGRAACEKMPANRDVPAMAAIAQFLILLALALAVVQIAGVLVGRRRVSRRAAFAPAPPRR